MTNHENLIYRIDTMEKQINKIDTNIQHLSGIVTDFIIEVRTKYCTKSEADAQYASKISEKIVFSMVWFILTSVLWWVLFVVLK